MFPYQEVRPATDFARTETSCSTIVGIPHSITNENPKRLLESDCNRLRYFVGLEKIEMRCDGQQLIIRKLPIGIIVVVACRECHEKVF